jgi:hypothetical protein
VFAQELEGLNLLPLRDQPANLDFCTGRQLNGSARAWVARAQGWLTVRHDRPAPEPQAEKQNGHEKDDGDEDEAGITS